MSVVGGERRWCDKARAVERRKMQDLRSRIVVSCSRAVLPTWSCGKVVWIVFPVKKFSAGSLEERYHRAFDFLVNALNT